MAESANSTYRDLTRAVEEFGFGPSDESDFDDGDSNLTEWANSGLLPSWEKFQITVRNASYNFIAGLRKEAENTEDSHKLVDQETREIDIQNELEAEADDEMEAKETEQVEYEDDDDEWDEIGRLPTFNQLQLTLRNASEVFALSPTIFSQKDSLVIPSLMSPSDLLAKWGGPMYSGSIGWQTFMSNFQLPSFLMEENDDDDTPLDLDDPLVSQLCSQDGVTDEDRAFGNNEDGITGCPHYLRNCKSECSKCLKFYMCHLCHDDSDQTHQMDRCKTKRMLCLSCLKPQPPRRKCGFCKEVMGDYFCFQCKLWSDDPDKPIYHCDKCEICRVGWGIGIDVFHCDTCGICMNLSVKGNHKCIEQAAKSNCPICLDDLFLSQKPTVFMPCGHPIHRECFTEYSKRYYRCPICSKSILNTSALFRMIDEEVKSEVLPPELANMQVNILCQDCRLKSRAKYHLAGLKCETCGSYNTARL